MFKVNEVDQQAWQALGTLKTAGGPRWLRDSNTQCLSEVVQARATRGRRSQRLKHARRSSLACLKILPDAQAAQRGHDAHTLLGQKGLRVSCVASPMPDCSLAYFSTIILAHGVPLNVKLMILTLTCLDHLDEQVGIRFLDAVLGEGAKLRILLLPLHAVSATGCAASARHGCCERGKLLAEREGPRGPAAKHTPRAARRQGAAQSQGHMGARRAARARVDSSRPCPQRPLPCRALAGDRALGTTVGAGAEGARAGAPCGWRAGRE